jgi:predicted deacylase
MMLRRENLSPHPVRVPPPDIERWRHGNTGVPFVHELASGLPGPEALVTALVHGNEYTGAIVLGELLATAFRPRRGRLTLAFCNVEAFARFDAAHPDASRFVDEDFNRVWGIERLEGGGDSAELRRARALRPFVDRCTHLLDLHSMHEPCPPLLVTGLLAHDIAFARRLECEGQIVIDEGHADGVRMRDYAGGVGVAQRHALLLEAGQHWDDAALAHARDVTMRWLVATGLAARDAAAQRWLRPEAPALPAVRVTHRVVARTPDFAFLGNYTGGEVFSKAGTPIAIDAGEPVLTPYDDCVLVMPSLRQLRPGVTAVRLGRAQPA